MVEINQIINLVNHCLHLCNNSNMEEIVFSYISDADAFVTNNNEYWENKFKEQNIDCRVKKPSIVKPSENIIVDGSSLENFEKWEKKWEKQNRSICIYNIDKLDPSILKKLIKVHDKMLLSINNVRIISDKVLEKEFNLNPEIGEKVIKKELKNIILSLLLSKPMCGTDLVKILYKKFKVFISPGMLYPTLHELEKKGLLKYVCVLKNKVYSVQEKEQTQLLLKKHAKVNSLLSQFLTGESY